jgi:hypothetical protein
MNPAESVNDLISAVIDSELENRQLVSVYYVLILDVIDEGANRGIALCATQSNVLQWLSYPIEPPVIGEVWRVVDHEGGPARLEDWVPNASFEVEGGVSANLLGHVVLVVGTQTAGQTLVNGQVLDIVDMPMAMDGIVLDLRVSDADVDAEPSGVATLGGVSVGEALAGSGTAQMHIRANAVGLFNFAVSSPTATRHIWIRQGPGSSAWIRHEAGPLSVVVL